MVVTCERHVLKVDIDELSYNDLQKTGCVQA
jgi:hypothetical protein